MITEIIKSYLFNLIAHNLLTEEKMREQLDEIVKKYGLDEKEVLSVFNEIRKNIGEIEKEAIAFPSITTFGKEFLIRKFNIATQDEVEKLTDQVKKLSKKVDRSNAEIKKLRRN